MNQESQSLAGVVSSRAAIGEMAGLLHALGRSVKVLINYGPLAALQTVQYDLPSARAIKITSRYVAYYCEITNFLQLATENGSCGLRASLARCRFRSTPPSSAVHGGVGWRRSVFQL